ncbi:MAG: hypothetical protein Q7J42_08025 [Sulfuritalea sp.]|nr:hypothetical protein [Sulfuritalea sp.]
MTRDYPARDFFRQMPNVFLARHLAPREVLQYFDFRAGERRNR